MTCCHADWFRYMHFSSFDYFLILYKAYFPSLQVQVPGCQEYFDGKYFAPHIASDVGISTLDWVKSSSKGLPEVYGWSLQRICGFDISCIST